jgi:phosphoribosylanthranilate isomerase
VDAIGLVFFPGSPRHVTMDVARRVVAEVPAFVTVVALFVDERADRVQEILKAVRVDLLQFHGDEDPEYCGQFGKPWIKAIRMRPGLDLNEIALRYTMAEGILLDAWDPEAQGGTGLTFDWGKIPREMAERIILAGGLSPANVAQALAEVGPYAVDVSSGVEVAKGIKDANQMAAFLNEVQEFDYRSKRSPGLRLP